MSTYEWKKMQDLVKQIFFHNPSYIRKDLWGAATCKKSLKWNNLVHAIHQDLLETHKWKFLWLFEFLPQKTLLYQLRKHLKQYFLQAQGRRLQETPLASSWRSIGGISIRKFTGRTPPAGDLPNWWKLHARSFSPRCTLNISSSTYRICRLENSPFCRENFVFSPQMWAVEQ